VKNVYRFLEVNCGKLNNVWLHASMQSDCLYSLIFEHYNCILLCDWVLECYCVCL